MRKRRETIKHIFTNSVLKTLKIFSTGFLALSFIVSQLNIITAYEAHMINVTARLTDFCDNYSILGYKFNDRNMDGHRDNGEDGLIDWTIKLQKTFEEQYDFSQDLVLNTNDVQMLQDIVDGVNNL